MNITRRTFELTSSDVGDALEWITEIEVLVANEPRRAKTKQLPGMSQY
jgi:hypothetical protein